MTIETLKDWELEDFAEFKTALADAVQDIIEDKDLSKAEDFAWNLYAGLSKLSRDELVTRMEIRLKDHHDPVTGEWK